VPNNREAIVELSLYESFHDSYLNALTVIVLRSLDAFLKENAQDVFHGGRGGDASARSHAFDPGMQT